MKEADRKRWVRQYWASYIQKSEPPDDAPDDILDHWGDLTDSIAHQLGLGRHFKAVHASADITMKKPS